jgi:integrase
MLQKLTVPLPKPQVTNKKDVALMPPGRHRVEGETGLYLFVSPDGQVRRWIFRYTSPVTKRPTETGLDLAKDVSLAQAKTKAGDMRKQIANRICPINAKRAERASAVTFREAADQWIEVHKAAWKPGKDGKDGSQMKNAKLLLHHHGKPLANKPVAEITSDMIQDALAKLWARAPNQGKRALGMFERVLDYGKAKGMRSGDNPAAWRGCFEYRFARRRAADKGHHLALPYEGMAAFMKDLRGRQGRGAGSVALEFTILTCVRTSEALAARWEEIDFDKSIWTVPKERMKGGKEHEVPLSDRAIEILKLQQQHSPGEYVFTGYNRTRLAERTMRSVLHFMDVDCTVHGFRSTFRDWAGDVTQFQREHVEACLAHRVGNDVELAYRRLTALEKRREILKAWAAYCTAQPFDRTSELPGRSTGHPTGCLPLAAKPLISIVMAEVFHC